MRLSALHPDQTKIANLKIGTRLAAVFAAVLLLMSAMLVIGIYELSRVVVENQKMWQHA